MITTNQHLKDRFGEERFELVYQDIINSNQGVSYNINHSARFAATIMYLQDLVRTGDKILELGWSNLLHKHLQKTVTCWDYTVLSDLGVCPYTESKTISVNGVDTESAVIRINFENDTFPDYTKKYDIVLCCEVIEHMEVDPMHILVEANKLLVPNSGKLFISTPNAISARNVYKILHGYHPSFFMKFSRARNFYRHNFEYTPSILSEMLLASGFELFKIETLDTYENPHDKGQEYIKKLNCSSHDRGDTIFMVAKRKQNVVDRFPSCIYFGNLPNVSSN